MPRQQHNLRVKNCRATRDQANGVSAHNPAWNIKPRRTGHAHSQRATACCAVNGQPGPNILKERAPGSDHLVARMLFDHRTIRAQLAENIDPLRLGAPAESSHILKPPVLEPTCQLHKSLLWHCSIAPPIRLGENPLQAVQLTSRKDAAGVGHLLGHHDPGSVATFAIILQSNSSSLFEGAAFRGTRPKPIRHESSTPSPPSHAYQASQSASPHKAPPSRSIRAPDSSTTPREIGATLCTAHWQLLICRPFGRAWVGASPAAKLPTLHSGSNGARAPEGGHNHANRKQHARPDGSA